MQNLKAKELSNFIDDASKNIFNASKEELESDQINNPIVFVGTNVNELNLTSKELSDIMTSYKVLKDEAEHEEATNVDILEQTEELGEEIIMEEDAPTVLIKVPPKKSKTPKIKPKFQRSKASQIIDEEMKAKESSFNATLRAYIDTCVQNGLVNRGYLTIIRARYKWKKIENGLKINDVFIYNQLMRGYAEKENYLKVQEIFNILNEDSIKPDATSYMVVLECLGRLIKNPSMQKNNHFLHEKELDAEIDKVLKESKKHFNLDEIMNKAVFVKDERELTMTAIHRVMPDYKPTYELPVLTYHNSLVNVLNENVQDASYDPIEKIHEKMPGSEILDSKTGFTKKELDEWIREQILNELNGEVDIKSCLVYPNPSPQVLKNRQHIEELHKKWREIIVSSFNRNYGIIRAEDMRSRGGISLLPYLRSLETEQYANIIISEIKKLTNGSESYSPYISHLYRTLGEKVEMRFHMEQKLKLGVLQKTSDVFEKYCDVIMAGNSSDNTRQCWQRLVRRSKEHGPSVEYQSQAWPISVKIAIGKFLYNIIIRDLKLDLQYLKSGKKSNETIPAFFTLFRHQGKFVKEEVKPHPALMKLYRGAQQENITFDVNLVPMVCPPQPYWTANNGGYLIAKTSLLRLPPNCYQQVNLVNNARTQTLYPILDALNQQQSIAWRINTDILDVVLEVFRKGGDDKLDIPELPSNLDPPENKGKISLTYL